MTGGDYVGFAQFSALIDWFNERIGKLMGWAVLAAVLVSALNALARYGLNFGSNALLELQWYLFGGVFLLAAAYTLKQNEHIRIDIVSSRLRRAHAISSTSSAISFS